MRAAMTQLNLSARAYHRTQSVKLARTIADLAGVRKSSLCISQKRRNTGQGLASCQDLFIYTPSIPTVGA